MKPSECPDRKRIEDKLEKNDEGKRALKKEGKWMQGSERQDMKLAFAEDRERLLKKLREHLDSPCDICNPTRDSVKST